MLPRVLVLGATGFLGRSISEVLAASGAVELIMHGRRASDLAGICADAESCTLDLLECRTGAIAALIEQTAPDVVVNCTGMTAGDADDMRAANVYLVMRLIVELEELNGVHLVHLGSGAEYGTHLRNCLLSEDKATTPHSDYGISKLKATEQLLRAVDNGRISATVLRVFNPVGRHSPPSTLAGSVARKIRAAFETSSQSIVFGALDARRDYVDTRDVARAVLAAVQRPHVNGLFNVGSGEAIESLRLVNTLAAIAGYDRKIVECTDRSARSTGEWQCADIRAINDQLGWAAEHTLEESLDEVWNGINAGVPT